MHSPRLAPSRTRFPTPLVMTFLYLQMIVPCLQKYAHLCVDCLIMLSPNNSDKMVFISYCTGISFPNKAMLDLSDVLQGTSKVLLGIVLLFQDIVFFLQVMNLQR